MLKAVVTDISTVEEAFRPLYTASNGKFILGVEAVDGYALEDVAGLRTALGAERVLKTAAEAKAKTFDGLDPVTSRAALARMLEFGDLDPIVTKKDLADFKKLAALDPNVEADKAADIKVKNARDQLTAAHNLRETALTGEIATLKTSMTKRDAQVQKLLKENVIKAELDKLEPLSATRSLIEMQAAQSIKMREVDGNYVLDVVDAAGNPRINTDGMTPTSVADYMAETRKNLPSLFKADAVGGIDMSGGNGAAAIAAAAAAKLAGNPFAAASRNFTAQMVMFKKDPAQYARLKAEAGIR